MASLFLKRDIREKKVFADYFFERLNKIYKVSLDWCLHHVKITVCAAFLALAGSLFLFTRLGAEFIPTLDEGDFAMIMGFPGSTQRYMTSYEIDRMLTITNPQRIFIRGERQKILAEDMLASDKVRIQYASKYAQSSNYWKNAMGMSRGIERLDVKRKKQEQERAFQQWAEANSVDGERYDEALGMIRDAIAASNEAYAAQQYLNEALQRSVEIMTPASYVIAAVGKKGKKLEDPEALKERLRGFYKDYNPATDRRVARRMFELVMEHVKELPDVFVAAEGQFDDLDAAVDYLYDNSVFADETRALEFVDRFSRERLDEDPAALLALSVTGKMLELQQAQKEANRNYADGHRLYIEGLMRQYSDRAWAADANFTIRLTYGQVLPYDPADGVTYHYYTTLRGVMEKEDPKNPTEFSVPDKLKELYAAQDFGAYANGRGELPVAFLANLDITGGNSGSPIMNGRGELLGLAFDGNWEAMRATWLSSRRCNALFRSISATCCSSSTSSPMRDIWCAR